MATVKVLVNPSISKVRVGNIGVPSRVIIAEPLSETNVPVTLNPPPAIGLSVMESTTKTVIERTVTVLIGLASGRRFHVPL